MKKYQVQIHTDLNVIKTYQTDNLGNALAWLAKFKWYAEERGLTWTVSLYRQHTELVQTVTTNPAAIIKGD